MRRIWALLALLVAFAGLGWLVLTIGSQANAAPRTPSYFPVVTGTLYGCLNLTHEDWVYYEERHPGEPCAAGWAQFQVVQPDATPSPSTSPSPSPSTTTSG